MAGQIPTHSPHRIPCRSRGCALKEAAAHGEPTQEQGPGRSCSPQTGAWVGADLLAALVAQGAATVEQSVPEGLHPVGRDPCWRSL